MLSSEMTAVKLVLSKEKICQATNPNVIRLELDGKPLGENECLELYSFRESDNDSFQRLYLEYWVPQIESFGFTDAFLLFEGTIYEEPSSHFPDEDKVRQAHWFRGLKKKCYAHTRKSPLREYTPRPESTHIILRG